MAVNYGKDKVASQHYHTADKIRALEGDNRVSTRHLTDTHKTFCRKMNITRN
jgi:phenylalanyl-tRNA synthetase alpha subunit